MIKYIRTPTHDLALRTIIELTKGLGPATIDSIYNYIGEKYTEKIFEKVKKPSFTTVIGKSSFKRKDPLNIWKEDLSKKQIEAALKILNQFDLEAMYKLDV